MKNLILIMFVLGLGVSAQAQRTGELDLFTPYFAQGLKEMNDLRYVGFSSSLGFNIPESPLTINAYFSGGTFNSRTEYLPMHTSESGYGEEIRIRSGGGVRNIGLGLRYSPWEAKEMRVYPFLELGVGHVRYRQNWNSRGDEDPESTPDCPKYTHQERGWINRSGTFYGSGEIGVMFRYPSANRDLNAAQAFFGFSVRYELGGEVMYGNPKAKKHHFYYNSGLGDEFDRPFLNDPGIESRALFDIARHQQLMYKVTLLRVVF
jgi:hypothetical protein